MNTLAEISHELQQTWKLSYEPISVRFADAIPANISLKPDNNFYSDTACTALCRCLKQEKVLAIAPENNCQNMPAQTCAGGNFFLKLGRISKEEAVQNYVEDEKVFRDEQVCEKFLQKIPVFPASLEKKFIILSPLSQEADTPQVVIFLANAAQASKILGLSVCHNYQAPEIIPAVSTCVSLYLPLVNNRVHVNFIDYYDRYYQGRQKDEQLIWRDDELIISMTFKFLQTMLKNLEYSPHGNFQRVQLDAQPFDFIQRR